MFRVVTLYAVVAWAVIQVVDVAQIPLGLPPWFMRVLLLTAMASFPVSFFLAWLIDWRDDGLIFDLPLWVGEEDHKRPPKKTDLVYAGLLGLVLAAGIYFVTGELLERAEQQAEPQVVDADLAPPNSIAVLAFKSFDTEEDTGHFASGLSEEILNVLAGVRELRVAARTSSFRFRNAEIDIREIAEILDVRTVLEGSVRRDGDRVRVTAQLIDGSDGYHFWSKTYNRTMDDIFAIQQEIASAVVNELKISLSVDSQQELGRRPTEDVHAHVFFLQGLDRLRSSIDADVMQTATHFFEQAIALDPTFARAYAGICEAQRELYDINRQTTSFDAAKAACEQAADLDPNLDTGVKLAIGNLYRVRGMLDEAEQRLTALESQAPEDVDVYIALGQLRRAQERDAEAESYLRRATELRSNYWRAHQELASFLYWSGRYEESLEVYEIVVALAPDVATIFGGQGAAYWMSGDRLSAIQSYQRSLQLKPSRLAYTNIGLLYYYEERYEEAVEAQLNALDFAPEDHRVLGRLAEALRFVGGREKDALQRYAQAATEARKSLEVNKKDWKTSALLGVYLAHLGERGDALRAVDRGVELSPEGAEPLYYQGLVRLIIGDRDGALDALEAAVATDDGYRQLVADEPDLKVLADDERFQRLLP